MSKRVLILGGCGFLGRNIVKYLIENKLTSKIRVVDKKFPEMVGLSKPFADAFEKVEFVQANLHLPEAIAEVYADPEGPYHFVINCVTADTRYSLEPGAYKEEIGDLSIKVATEAAKQHVDKFIQISTALVYEAGSKPKDEHGKIEPWISLAKASYEACEALKQIQGLNLLIIRPAIIYGPGDINGLGQRIAVAAVYKKLNKRMKLLWGGQLKINTVHVSDVVRALWFLATHSECGLVYNLADKNDTDQEKLNTVLAKIFGITYGYKSKLTSQVASKISMAMVTEEVNSRHIDPWAAICKENGIVYSRLTPFLDEELLYNADLCVDGSGIEKLGFSYEFPYLTEKILRDVIDEYIAAETFPKNFI